ncbi:hypothetical protein K443DRAFT_642440 [Laccaria amethystina LaAM-08-1]|uniref:Uncharacterized protein n=1 Tax=Laccaria amethystina LaAM-08-1 TaxID=1095629 RepID=A0A0C9XU38_9AGAR|nr:hypothetical protein K443DRAFT_642440 [Laccaria amethystina LaAM-08-1]
MYLLFFCVVDVYYIPNVSLILLYLTDLNYDGSHVIVLGKSRRTCSPDIFAGHSKSQTYWPSHTPDPSRRLPGALNAHGVKIVFHMQGIELETLRTQARQTMVPPEPPWPH